MKLSGYAVPVIDYIVLELHPGLPVALIDTQYILSTNPGPISDSLVARDGTGCVWQQVGDGPSAG